MLYNIEDIYNLLQKALGTIKGLYINEESLTLDRCAIDYEIYTDLENKTILDYWNNENGFHFDCGATKLVIVPKNKKYVIKIPFSGLYRYNIEEDTYEESEVPTYEIIRGNKVNWDICETEINVYNKVSDLAKKVIMPNIYIGEYCGVPVYIQEKIKTTFAATDYADINIKEYFKKFSSKAREAIVDRTKSSIEKVFIDQMINEYGIKDTLTILKELEESIDDLHEYNYGYNLENKCVLFDIGGYSNSLWEDSI